MAAEVPGWCKRCGEPLTHAERSPGRAREFCGDRCRQAFHRQVRLRQELTREVGLTDAQMDRLLDLFQVSKRRAHAPQNVTA